MPPARPSSSISRATRTLNRMAPHLTHVGVHDHGFNNVSTYGGLWRLAREGRIDAPPWEMRFYELALKVSGAVQATRWTTLPDGGYIYSFNGAHSLFVDTIRSLRALGAVAHARAPSLGGAGRLDQPARPAGPARARDRRVRRLLRARPRRLRRARPHCRTRASSTSPTAATADRTAAGLFAVLDLDPRTGVGHDRLRRTARVRGDPSERRARRRREP